MAQFYGTVKAGSQEDITGHIRGWEIGGRVEIYHKDGVDICRLYKTTGISGKLIDDEMIAQFNNKHKVKFSSMELCDAAPDLLVACKYALRCLNRHEAPDGMIGVEARNILGFAIKKAEGE